VFWAGGVRLLIAGIRQVVQPRFTAEEIFRIHDRASFPIVREVGFANLSTGLLGICSLFRVGWVVPAAIVAGLVLRACWVGACSVEEQECEGEHGDDLRWVCVFGARDICDS
jgi:hypothetical protein